MRHIWGFASAIGLFVFVVFGTWGCLTRNVDDPTAARSMLVALGGLALMIVGLFARGDGPSALLKVRQIVASLGLVLTPIVAVLAFLALGTDAGSEPLFLLVLLLAIAAWAQGIAAQTGLSFRLAFVWLGTFVVLIAGGGVAGLLIAVVLLGLGLGSTQVGLEIRGIAIAVIALLGGAWARGRPDRLAVPGALVRAALGRATPGDVELLAAGPRAILRRRPGTDPYQQRVDATVAAADARLGDPDAISPHADADARRDEVDC